MIPRIFLAAALTAVTTAGHAAASILIALLTITAWLARNLLPVLPELAITGEALAVLVFAWLAFRELRYRPRIAAVAR